MTVRGGGATTQAAIPRLAASTSELCDSTPTVCAKLNNFIGLTKPPGRSYRNALTTGGLTAIAMHSSVPAARSQGLVGFAADRGVEDLGRVRIARLAQKVAAGDELETCGQHFAHHRLRFDPVQG